MRVVQPENLGRAGELLAADPSLIPIAGATDVMVHWPTNLDARDHTYLDLSYLAELRPVRWTDDLLSLGALTTYWDVIQDERIRAEFPLLGCAARQVGAVQIQSRGTWAGNIINASPAADGVPVLMAYDAVVVLSSASGTRRIELSEFYLGYKKMQRNRDELVTAIELPRRAYSFEYFEKVGPRRAQAITKVGVAISRSEQGWRVVANSVAPTVRRCRATEAFLHSARPGAIGSPDDFIQPLRTDVAPIDDIRSTALYRETVLANLIYHAVQGAVQGTASPTVRPR